MQEKTLIYSKFTIPYVDAAVEWFFDNLKIRPHKRDIRIASLHSFPDEGLPGVEILRLTHKNLSSTNSYDHCLQIVVPMSLYKKIHRIQSNVMPHATISFIVDAAIILYVEKLYDIQGKKT